MMGHGKTEFLISYINSHPEKKFLCILPTLSEIDRYRENVKAQTSEPRSFGSKFKDFMELIEKGGNVFTTHALIQKMNIPALELLREKDYTLIIDECLDVLSPYEGIQAADKRILFNQKLITLDPDGYVTWNDDSYTGKFDEVRNLCSMRSLMGYADEQGGMAKILMWNFPQAFFECFEDTFIATYMWSGSIQKSYFDVHGIQYDVVMLDGNDGLMPYSEERERAARRDIASLITICENEKLNKIGRKIGKAHPLSKSWYQQKAKDPKQRSILSTIKANTESFFRFTSKTGSTFNMYTVFDPFKKYVKGKGYSKDAFNKDVKSNRDPNKRQQKESCFVPCNARGTNDFRHKTALAYLIDLHPHPDISKFVTHYGMEFNEDAFSLSALLQWVWRSQIRDGKPIQLYIPSERMRNLLIDWMTV